MSEHHKKVKPLPSFKTNVEESETVPGQDEAKTASPPKDKRDSDVLETEQDNTLENVMRLFSEQVHVHYNCKMRECCERT